MKYAWIGLLIAGMLCLQISVGNLAQPSNPALATTELNPASQNVAWQVASFPLRLVTGLTGIALGAVGGSIKSIVHTEEEFARQTFGLADDNPLLLPVGFLSLVAAIPVGIVKGAPSGAAKGGVYGYQLWDQF